MALARGLRDEGHKVDLRVVELAALLHDIAADARSGTTAEVRRDFVGE